MQEREEVRVKELLLQLGDRLATQIAAGFRSERARDAASEDVAAVRQLSMDRILEELRELRRGQESLLLRLEAVEQREQAVDSWWERSAWEHLHAGLSGWSAIRSGELALFLLFAGWHAGGLYLCLAVIAALLVDPTTAVGVVVAVAAYKAARVVEKSRLAAWCRRWCKPTSDVSAAEVRGSASPDATGWWGVERLWSWAFHSAGTVEEPVFHSSNEE